MNRSRPKPVPDGKPKPQRGFSLWELAVLLGLLGLAIVAGFALLKSNRAQQIESERMAQLSAADRALAGFITEKGRLPCPDTTGSGLENCSGSAQKGWLPVVTLGLAASAPARGVARLSYIVYRGAGADLTVLAADRYNPLRLPALLNLYATSYTYNQLNILDFCVGLTLAANVTAGNNGSTTSAYIPGPKNVSGVPLPINVAYALAESGIDVDGDGNLFDGLNASTAAPVLESPARASDTVYDDRVQARSFYALQDTLKCPQATRSVDAISHAVEVGVTVEGLKLANLINAGVLSLSAGVAVAMDITAVALTAGAIVAGGVILTEATAALAADTAACAACVVLVGCAACAKIPVDAAAIALATAGLVVAAAAVTLVVTVSLPLEAIALAAAIIATAKAGVMLAVDTTYPPEVLTQLQTAATDAATKASAAEAAASAARSAATAARDTYDNNVASLYNVAHTYDGAHNNDTILGDALTAYKNYTSAALAYSNAYENAQAKRKEADAAAAAAAIAAADAAANPSDANKQTAAANLQTRATNLASAATLAENDANNIKKPAMDTAYASYITARDNALAAYPVFGQSAISAALDSTVRSWFDPASRNSYAYKDMYATNLESAAQTARTSANAMQAAYERLRDASTNPLPSGGPPLGSFSGAEAILKAADAKGALE